MSIENEQDMAGMRAAGVVVRDTLAAMRAAVAPAGLRVVRTRQGHGIGRTIHDDPMIPNWPDPDARDWLTDGLVITLEPIIAAGRGDAREADDGWTILTRDGSLAAHFEHTMV